MPDGAPASHLAPGNLMQGKRGLIMGVANERSIAWGIAAACAAQGGRTGFYLSGRGTGQAGQAIGG